MRQPTPDANIAPANPQDFDEVIALLDAAALPTEDLARRSMTQFLVARDESGKLIGAIGVERYGHIALLRSLVVAPDCRNRDLGTQLMAKLEALCRSWAMEGLYLLTTTARDFFARRGYKEIGREAVPMALRAASEFTRLCPDSAACMTKSL